MIRKISRIKNFAVFQDFKWEQSVVDKDGNPLTFKDINILYGRNYSGKTTLSRILRAFETGPVSDKFGKPEFELEMDAPPHLTQSDITSHNEIIRVFNDDFVRDNLRFIANSDDDIEPFAVLGQENVEIEQRIEELESKIGSAEDGNETGLQKDYLKAKEASAGAQQAFKRADKAIDDSLIEEARSIKKQSVKFGDVISYDKRNLKDDIQTVSADEYQKLSDEEQNQLSQAVKEEALPDVQELAESVQLNFGTISEKVKETIEKTIGVQARIQELVQDAMLSQWVKQGVSLHRNEQGKRQKCAFCGNVISEGRWSELDKHFDEESAKLSSEIDDLIAEIDTEEKALKAAISITQSAFYSEFHPRIVVFQNNWDSAITAYSSSLMSLRKQLEKRKSQLFVPLVFVAANDVSQQVRDLWEEIRVIIAENNQYTNDLNKKIRAAQEKLRLTEVFDYIQRIKYAQSTIEASDLSNTKDDAENEEQAILNEIKDKESQIATLKTQLKDESRGAKKVNELLKYELSHPSLSLMAIEGDDQQRSRFEIRRDGRKAYHLSEGECSIVAFCYFIARLENTETTGKKPIIWIDDPISSLDGNHVFYVFSLIKERILESHQFQQLFISTHDLYFLKYLKRMTGKFQDQNGKLKDYQRCCLIIERCDTESDISIMPKYLKEYVTEFNHLFHQIYQCANIKSIDDSNYTIFYHFGNNARKFLELYLYFKYPDNTDDSVKLKQFFAEKGIPPILLNRLDNEYSHLNGCFERGETPVEQPEMQKAAKCILDRLKVLDEDQYKALKRSIGASSQS